MTLKVLGTASRRTFALKLLAAACCTFKGKTKEEIKEGRKEGVGGKEFLSKLSWP